MNGNMSAAYRAVLPAVARLYADNILNEPAIPPLLRNMADEIELLRGYRDAAESDAAIAHLLVDKLRLTDEERDAIQWSISDQIAGGHQDHPAVKENIAILHGLLKRTEHKTA